MSSLRSGKEENYHTNYSGKLKNYEIENCKFLNLKPSQYIKNDISLMHDIITNDDYFNQAFFQDILIFNNLTISVK